MTAESVDTPDVSQINAMLEQCTDDSVLYDIACRTGTDPDTIIQKARGRDASGFCFTNIKFVLKYSL